MQPDDAAWLTVIVRAIVTCAFGACGILFWKLYDKIESQQKQLEHLNLELARNYPTNASLDRFSERVSRSLDQFTVQLREFQAEMHRMAVAMARKGKEE